MDLVAALQEAIGKKDPRLPRCVTPVVCNQTDTVYLRGTLPSHYLVTLAVSATKALAHKNKLQLESEIHVALR